MIRALCHLRDHAAPGRPARGREGVGLLPQASPPHALPRLQGKGHRHRLGCGRGSEQDPCCAKDEALRHALKRLVGGQAVLTFPCPAQIRPLRERVEGHDRRRTGQRQHHPQSRPGAGCLNKAMGAATTTAIRDSYLRGCIEDALVGYEAVPRWLSDVDVFPKPRHHGWIGGRLFRHASILLRFQEERSSTLANPLSNG